MGRGWVVVKKKGGGGLSDVVRWRWGSLFVVVFSGECRSIKSILGFRVFGGGQTATLYCLDIARAEAQQTLNSKLVRESIPLAL